MNVILLGAPGAGKGTLAKKLIKDYSYIQMSTGDLMRKEIKKNTVLGKECAKYINEGNLVSDNITIKIVKNFLIKKHDKLIFDGFPRTIAQAIALEEILKSLGSKIDRIIYIDVPTDILLIRISGRMICTKCNISYHLINYKPKIVGICDNDGTQLIRRPDDIPEKFQIRLNAYINKTAPLINYFKNKKNKNFIHIIDNNKNASIDDMFKKVIKLL